MIIPCFRCGKELDTPNNKNADYIIAKDTITREPREVLVALKHNQVTLARVDKIKSDKIEEERLEGVIEPYPPTKDFILAKFLDDEYDKVEVSNIQTARQRFGEDLVKVIVEVRDKDIQKSGVICPDCYKDTDVVIWGVHKANT